MWALGGFATWLLTAAGRRPGATAAATTLPSAARGKPRRVAQATCFSTRTSMALTAALKRALRGLASSSELTLILHPDSPLRAHPFSHRLSAALSTAQAMLSRRQPPS